MGSEFQLFIISAICEETKTSEKSVKEFLAENKYKIASAVGGTVAGVGATIAAAPVVLGAAGLGAAGAAAGSIASAVASTGAFSAIAGAGFLGGMGFMGEMKRTGSDFCKVDPSSEPEETSALTTDTRKTGPQFICNSEGRCCLNRNS